MVARGRPRTFDREQALRSALNVFWTRGYDGATLEELLAAMGNLKPPSFYAAFGSKDELFREAVELYRDEMGMPTVRALEEAPTAREGVNAMLRRGVEQFCSGEPRGCLIVLGALNCTRTNKDAHDYLRAMRQQAPDFLRERLIRGINDGDLPAGAPVADMVSFYTTLMHGLAVRARDGNSRQALMASVDAAMAAWDPLVGASSKSRRSSTKLTSARRHRKSRSSRKAR
jgi:AcrR family transcriptional regulator